MRPTSLSVAQGEFVALIGPSGSGKTTLLSMLGGMLAPTPGQVLFEGRSLYDLPVAERARLRNEQIGFVFQHFNLVPWLTAVENVALPLCLYGTDSHIQHTRAMELLTRFGLADRAEHRPSELSAGQQQRVALARTLVTDPRLILADEPTGNLDPDSRELVLQSLHAIHAEGRTIVLVTHDQSVSAAAAQQVLQIADGEVAELGTAQFAGIPDSGGVRGPPCGFHSGVSCAYRAGLSGVPATLRILPNPILITAGTGFSGIP